MLDAAKRTGKKLTIGYQNRQTPQALYVHQACEDGVLGDIYYGNAIALRRRAVPTWGVFLNEDEQGGGPLIDIGTHALDLTLWCMNNYKPKMVVGTKYRKLADQTQTANAWGDWDPEKFTVEDSAFGFVVMENGATIILQSSWALNILDANEAAFRICGTKAGADTVNNSARINGVRYGRQYVEQPTLTAGGVAFYDGANASPAVLDMAQWIHAIRTDSDPCVLPEQALCVTRILEAIYESSKTGMPVYFND